MAENQKLKSEEANLSIAAKRLCFKSFNNDNGERLKTAVSLVLWKVFENSGVNETFVVFGLK